MATGTVKWFNNSKGFGFIQMDGGQDVFVRETDIAAEGLKQLNEGDRVEFDICEGEKGAKAVHVALTHVSRKSVESDEALTLLVDPGDATAEELGELLLELSKLYRMLGGSGITFASADAKEPEFA